MTRTEYREKIEALRDRLTVDVTRIERAPEATFSRRAYERNDWTPRPKVTWRPTIALDGATIEPDASGSTLSAIAFDLTYEHSTRAAATSATIDLIDQTLAALDAEYLNVLDGSDLGDLLGVE